VQTAATLQVLGRPAIFATGDCAVIAANPRPPSGVWAVRAAPVLAINLQRALTGRPLRRWRPQRLALQLLGDGGAAGAPRAIALWGPLALGPSRWLWQLKDRIDRRFMAGLESGGSAMAGADANAMACRGCAAKVGAATLETALQQLESPGGRSQQAGQPLDQDDAAVVGSGPGGQWLLQSVDGFPALVSDAWLNGRLTTLHACSDLWACGAQLESAQAVVTLPVLGPRLQSDLLHQTLAGVRSVLDPLGARLIGGHTLEARDAIAGAGLSLVLTVNGSAPAGRLWPKGPLQPGDALILVRPIGTGVLFAAAMAGAAQAGWIDGALAVMQQNQAPLVALLAAHGCRACTDITGFGLLGHLGEMLAPAGDGATTHQATETRLHLDTSALAALALPGALELLGAGHASTLAPANGRALTLLEGPVALREPASAALLQLLIDPQTCGPLLAALPATRAPKALAALHHLGFDQAAVIGQVMEP
jgi:selenide,water dikinase